MNDQINTNDISYYKNQCEKIAQSEKMYRLICDTSDSAYVYQNLLEGSIRTVGNWSCFFGLELCEAKDLMGIFDYIEVEHAIALREIIYLEKTGRRGDSAVFKMRDGVTWVECSATVIYDDDGVATDKILRFSDISKLKSVSDELRYMAYHDLMTGLYNRNHFVRLLGEFVRRAEAAKKKIAVLFINIDDFRQLNDSMGMSMGDEVVQMTGRFLGEFKCDDVLVSHFSVASYCIGVYDPVGQRSVEALSAAIYDRLKWPFYLSNQQEVTISASIGVAHYPDSALTTLDLINCAEVVMCKARSMGHNTIKYFDAQILQEFLQNVTMETKLKEAAFNQNFSLHFQPQYLMEGTKLRGFEALIRWRDDDGNMISPMKFIPLAEKNGTIIPIGAWVMDESIRIFAEWRKEYDYPMILSVNVSAIQYAQTDFINNLIEVINKYGVRCDEIELELTESILISEFQEVIEKFGILREHGIRISLDDFGTGYSSLSYLHGLPITTLKIDKSFVEGVLTNENTRLITESIINMVKKMGFETIAEGVESKEQFEYLESIGCDAVQGYYLNSPMAPEEVEQHVLCYI